MIAIVTDSTAPITRQEAVLCGVSVVPHSYVANGTAYMENYEDMNNDYTNRLTSAGSNAFTGQSTTAAFSTVFRKLLAQGFDILCIVISSRLSGTWSGAVTAAREIGHANIAVIDSHATAGALYYQVMMARQLADKGLPFSEIADRCGKLCQKAEVAFSVEDMSALRRSRRLGTLSQSVNTILNCRPVFLLKNGTIVLYDLAHGRKNRVEMMASLVPKNANQIMVQGFGKTPIANSLTHLLQEKYPRISVLQREIGPVISTHIGTEALCVSWCLA
jgi:DegV family protein with EDD domain